MVALLCFKGGVLMNYNSTRSKDYECTSAHAIKTGLAPDGGLFVPDDFPSISIHEIDKMKDCTYVQRAQNIIGKYRLMPLYFCGLSCQQLTAEEIDLQILCPYRHKRHDAGGDQFAKWRGFGIFFIGVKGNIVI